MGMFVEPIPGTLGEDKEGPGEPVLGLGILPDDRVLVVFPDGSLSASRLYLFRTDWRYDPEKKVWHDVDRPLVDEDETDDD